MENNRTVIVALVIAVIAAVVFLNFEKFGEITKAEMTELYVSSEADVMSENNPVVGKGEYVYFTEIPGSEGGAGTLYVRSIENGRKWGQIVRTQTFKDCNERKCNPDQIGTLKFTTYYDWEGKYCGEVKDFATWKKVITCFTVK